MELLLAQTTDAGLADLGKAIAFGVGVGLGAVGAGIGLGTIFGSMIQAVARQPELREELTGIQWLGFALVEAVRPLRAPGRPARLRARLDAGLAASGVPLRPGDDHRGGGGRGVADRRRPGPDGLDDHHVPDRPLGAPALCLRPYSEGSSTSGATASVRRSTRPTRPAPRPAAARADREGARAGEGSTASRSSRTRAASPSGSWSRRRSVPTPTSRSSWRRTARSSPPRTRDCASRSAATSSS